MLKFPTFSKVCRHARFPTQQRLFWIAWTFNFCHTIVDEGGAEEIENTDQGKDARWREREVPESEGFEAKLCPRN